MLQNNGFAAHSPTLPFLHKASCAQAAYKPGRQNICPPRQSMHPLRVLAWSQRVLAVAIGEAPWLGGDAPWLDDDAPWLGGGASIAAESDVDGLTSASLLTALVLKVGDLTLQALNSSELQARHVRVVAFRRMFHATSSVNASSVQHSSCRVASSRAAGQAEDVALAAGLTVGRRTARCPVCSVCSWQGSALRGTQLLP